MAAIRAALIFAAILTFFFVGVPLQWLAATRAPRRAAAIPRLFCRTLLALAKVRVATTGSLLREHPLLCVANHVSWLDILALGSLEPFCFLAKRDVAGWPVVSAFAEVQGTVFVERARRRSIVPANAALAARMGEGRAALLFPEGTTSAGPEPGPFLSSHLAAARDLLALDASRDAVAVQPVAIAYSSPVAAWIGDDALLPHLWRVLRGPSITCSVRLGAPIAYAPGADRKQIARAARAAVCALLASRPQAADFPAPEAAVGLAATTARSV